MPITDRGRWTSTTLDERGKIVKGSLSETGGLVFGIPLTPTEPSAPPIPTIISVDKSIISDEIGADRAVIKFKFDTDVTQWSVNVMGTSSTTGTIADSGGSVSAGTEITAIIDYTELYQEGYNKVNIYGLNGIGWTPYEEDPNAKRLYYLQIDGVDDYLQLPSMTLDRVDIDVMVEDGIHSFEGILFDARTGLANGYIFGNGNGGGLSQALYKVDGILAESNPLSNKIGKRVLVSVTPSQFTDDVTIGANYPKDTASTMKGKIYKITCCLGGTIKAVYDMSTGTVLDQSGNGNHATLVGGTWIEQPKYYLSMDGVDDVINTPLMTANEIVIDMILDTNNKQQGIVTLSNGYIIANQDGSITANNITPNYIDGVLYNSTTNRFPFDKRFTYRGIYGSGVTATGYIFKATSNGTQAKGKLYSAKYYQNGVLVAHYDMSTGTLDDQSGNGNHATLTGGTWVQI